MLVIVGNPDFQGRDQLKWAGPFRERDRHPSSSLCITRSVSAFPVESLPIVQGCGIPRVPQARIKAVEVGWHPLSLISARFWPRTPAGNWRLTALSGAKSQCWG